MYWIFNNNVKGEQRYNRTIWIVLICLGIWLVQPLIFIDPDSNNNSKNMENDPKIEMIIGKVKVLDKNKCFYTKKFVNILLFCEVTKKKHVECV